MSGTFHLPVQTRAPLMGGLRRRMRVWWRRHDLDERADVRFGVGVILAVVALVTFGVFSGVAGAATISSTPTLGTIIRATANIAPGSLAFVAAPPSLSWVVADTGRAISDRAMVGGTEPIEVADATGSGAGWQVDLSTTPFTTSTGHVLPTTAATVQTAPTYSCDATDFGGCTVGTNGATYPYQVPAGSTSPTATILASAATTTGMGDQTIEVPFDLSVPAGAYAGAYTSTWTFTLISGPGSGTSSGGAPSGGASLAITDSCPTYTTSLTTGSAVTCTLSVSGGTGPYTWSSTDYTGLPLSLTQTPSTSSVAHLAGTLSSYGSAAISAHSATSGGSEILVSFEG